MKALQTSGKVLLAMLISSEETLFCFRTMNNEVWQAE